jgi:hypothetical protein
MRAGPARASFLIAHFVMLGVLTQAVLAGFFVYGDPALVRLHFHLGSLVVALSLVLLIVAASARFEASTALVPLALALFVLSVGQFVLGLIGRSSSLAAALHVPNAFLVFTVVMLWLTRARRALKEGP